MCGVCDRCGMYVCGMCVVGMVCMCMCSVCVVDVVCMCVWYGAVCMYMVYVLCVYGYAQLSDPEPLNARQLLYH